MAVKDILKASADAEIEQINKYKEKVTKAPSKENTKSRTPGSAASNSDAPAPKHPGGRPTNKEKGLQNRKQYSLTLPEDTYLLFLDAAQKEGRSFAKFMELAALEYLKNHTDH